MAKYGENIYKRKDGRWEGRVIKEYNEKGKAIYAYFYGRSYKEVKDKIFMPSPSVKGFSESNTAVENAPRFDDVLDMWLERKKIKVKKSSYVKYVNLIDNHIKPSLGRYILTDISGALVTSYILKKQKTGKRGSKGGFSEKTANDILVIIKSALKFAKNEGLLSDVININIAFSHEKPKEMRVLSKEEQSSFEKYLCSDMDSSKLGILLCLYTGLRVGEICALKWSDIALGEHTLTVSRTMQRLQTKNEASNSKTEVIITNPKSDCSTRTIPLPECLWETLEAFKPAVPDAYFLTGEAERYIEPRTYQNRFKSYIDDSGIKDANFHSMRHTFATRCVELDFEIKSLSEILGHANATITLNLYVHPSFDLKRTNMNKLSYLH